MSDEKAQLFASVKAHLDRGLNTLAYLDREYDLAVAIIEARKQATGPMRAKMEFVLCIFPLAPLDKIQKCIAEGGLVCAIIGTKLEWTTAAIRATGGVRGVQIMSCSATTAMIMYSGGATIELPNPGKQILAVFLLWPGG